MYEPIVLIGVAKYEWSFALVDPKGVEIREENKRESFRFHLIKCLKKASAKWKWKKSAFEWEIKKLFWKCFYISKY